MKRRGSNGEIGGKKRKRDGTREKKCHRMVLPENIPKQHLQIWGQCIRNPHEELYHFLHNGREQVNYTERTAKIASPICCE